MATLGSITTAPAGDPGTGYSMFEAPVVLAAGAAIPLGTWLTDAGWTLTIAGGPVMTMGPGVCVSDGTNVTSVGGNAVRIR